MHRGGLLRGANVALTKKNTYIYIYTYINFYLPGLKDQLLKCQSQFKVLFRKFGFTGPEFDPLVFETFGSPKETKGTLKPKAPACVFEEVLS